jgi:hypothetical protein
LPLLFVKEQPRKSNCYEHIRDAKTRHDAQTMDTATETQQQMMQRPKDEREETVDNDITQDEFHMLKDKEDLKVFFSCNSLSTCVFV